MRHVRMVLNLIFDYEAYTLSAPLSIYVGLQYRVGQDTYGLCAK